MDRIRPYAGWAALFFLVAAVFGGLIAANVIVPLFLLITAGALAAFRYWDQLKTFEFWAFDEWLRMRYEAISVPEWHAPHYAAELFCSQVAVKTRNEAAAEMNILMMDLIKSNDPNAVAGTPNRNERNARYDAAQVRFNQCNTSLSREMLGYLTRGHLLAKGLPNRDGVAQAEHIIPTSRWRVMSLDIAKAHAMGMGWHYEGVVVGVKPRPRKPAPPPAQAKPSDRAGTGRVTGRQQPPSERPRPPRPSA
jgi:hypothetical protein